MWLYIIEYEYVDENNKKYLWIGDWILNIKF